MLNIWSIALKLEKGNIEINDVSKIAKCIVFEFVEDNELPFELKGIQEGRTISNLHEGTGIRVDEEITCRTENVYWLIIEKLKIKTLLIRGNYDGKIQRLRS